MDTTTRNEYNPETVSPPGATVQDLLDERRMTRTDLAGYMGRSRAFVDRLIHDKEALSQEVALELEHALNVPTRFWNQREHLYRTSSSGISSTTSMYLGDLG